MATNLQIKLYSHSHFCALDFCTTIFYNVGRRITEMFFAYPLFVMAMLCVLWGVVAVFTEKPTADYTKAANVCIPFISAVALSVVAAVAKYLFG